MFKWSGKRFVSFSRILLVVFVLFFIFSYSIASRIHDRDKKITPKSEKSLIQSASMVVAYPFLTLFQAYDKMIEDEKKRLKNCNSHIMNAYIDLQEKYKHLEVQNNQLKELTKFVYKDTQVIATARPIITTAGFFSKIIRINAGANQNIKVGDIAVTEEGLVGRVIDVYAETCDILPIHHSLSKIAGMTKRENVKLLLSGRARNKVVAEYASEPLLLREGDEIITLSDGGRLPYGIRIGTIDNVNKRPISVNLAVNFASLDYIEIIRLNPISQDISQEDKKEPLEKNTKKDDKNT